MVLSFPGPDRSSNMADLRAGPAVSRRYRNRSIGESLKELNLTEGRSTGIPKILRAMRDNGSSPAEFHTDDDHTLFPGDLMMSPHKSPHELFCFAGRLAAHEKSWIIGD